MAALSTDGKGHESGLIKNTKWFLCPLPLPITIKSMGKTTMTIWQYWAHWLRLILSLLILHTSDKGACLYPHGHVLCVVRGQQALSDYCIAPVTVHRYKIISPNTVDSKSLLSNCVITDCDFLVELYSTQPIFT